MRGAAVPLLTLTAALVLADSAIVTLALPEILRRLDGSVTQVAWVLIAFNLVLALVVVPAAAVVGRRDPAPLCAAGIAVFAAASAACAVAGSMEVLIAARCLQAVGGAFALVGGLELIVAEIGERRGVAAWVAAGVIGTAAGPVAGGLLTEAFSWRAIFLVQVPVAALAVPAALAVRTPAVRTSAVPATPRHPPAVRPNVALALLSAALTAALFLLVLLLVDGCLLIAGGLAALALPPSADLAWTVAPQALVGLGLGLTVDSLTSAALRDRFPRALHGGWTIGARHAGVVLGLAILTPVFTADLRDAQAPAQEAITALVLDAPLPASDKIALARGLGDRLVAERGRVPDLHPAFAALKLGPAERPAAAQLERDLDAQLERAATRAFRDSFLVGAGLALLALLALVPVGRRGRT